MYHRNGNVDKWVADSNGICESIVPRVERGTKVFLYRCRGVRAWRGGWSTSHGWGGWACGWLPNEVGCETKTIVMVKITWTMARITLVRE